MKREQLRGQVGNWVTGEEFWNREQEVQLLRRYINDGAHVLVAAPRRVGKTSLMREVVRQLEDEYYCVFVDVENCQCPEDAIVEISKETRAHAGLWVKTKVAFHDVFSALSANVDLMGVADLSLKLRDGVMGRWQHRGDQLFASLVKADKPLVLFIDELPILINRMLHKGGQTITPEARGQADIFLSWLRSICQTHQAELRFVVSGSIGMGPVLGRANLSATMNHFTRFELDAWDKATAQGCLHALAKHRGLRFEDTAEETVTDLLGWCIPHHVQAIFDRLYADARKAKRDTIDPFDVTRVYRDQMLSVRGHTELKHYEERLQMVLDQELFPLACELLTEAAVVPGGLSNESALFLWNEHRGEPHDVGRELRTIVEILEHDGYLKRDAWDRNLIFVSNLIRDWWRGRFSAFFTPVSGREERV